MQQLESRPGDCRPGCAWRTAYTSLCCRAPADTKPHHQMGCHSKHSTNPEFVHLRICSSCQGHSVMCTHDAATIQIPKKACGCHRMHRKPAVGTQTCLQSRSTADAFTIFLKKSYIPHVSFLHVGRAQCPDQHAPLCLGLRITLDRRAPRSSSAGYSGSSHAMPLPLPPLASALPGNAV